MDRRGPGEFRGILWRLLLIPGPACPGIRSVFDLVAPAPLNSFGNPNMITQESEELRLTFIEEKKTSID